MKLITAVIRPNRLSQVKEALFNAGVRGITIARVSGHGGQGGIVEQYRGSQFIVEFSRKSATEYRPSVKILSIKR